MNECLFACYRKHSYSFKKPPYMSLRFIKKVSQTGRQLVNLDR